MPRGGACAHRKCQGDPTGCRMLTDEELAPTEADTALGEQLVAERWIQVSAKYRTVMRWKVEPPAVELLLAKDSDLSERWCKMRDILADRVRPILGSTWEHEMRMCTDTSLVEERTLTVRQFEAFKRARAVGF